MYYGKMEASVSFSFIVIILLQIVMIQTSNLPLVINTWPFSNATAKGTNYAFSALCLLLD